MLFMEHSSTVVEFFPSEANGECIRNERVLKFEKCFLSSNLARNLGEFAAFVNIIESKGNPCRFHPLFCSARENQGRKARNTLARQTVCVWECMCAAKIELFRA